MVGRCQPAVCLSLPLLSNLHNYVSSPSTGYSLTTLDKCLGDTSAYRKDNADSRPASDAPASVSSAVGASVSLAIVAAVFGML